MTVQISFAGSGGMYHYYLGIAKVLQDNFDLSNVIYGATSGGCLPALLLLLGEDIDKIHYECNHEILKEVSGYWLGSLFNWNSTVRKHVYNYLFDDVHTIVNDKLFISVTKLEFPVKNEIVSHWDSKDDLIECIQCSGFIPLLFEPRAWYWYRDSRYIDGGFTNNCVKTGEGIPHIYITTDMWRQVNYNWIWCYSDTEWAEQLYKWGKEDAMEHLDTFAHFLKKTTF